LIWFEKKETPNERSSDEEIQKKVQKKIKYVEKRLLDKMLADVEEKDEIIKTNFSITSTEIFPLFGRMAILEQALSSLGSIAGIGDDQAKNNLLEELKKLDLSPFTDITIQKVTIDRLTNASEPYAQTDLFLLERNLQINSDVLLTLKPTFFFLYQIPEELEGKFRGALSFLAEEGIGGGRSQGSGVFNETKFRDIDIFIKGNEFSINLSLLFPEKSEINRVVAYELILRGGYITSGRGTQFIKNQVRMLKEGSVFRGIPKGSTPVVSTNTVSGTIGHPVYQYGLNFPLSFGG
jgi:CRISPR type III-A-associated RAMP protein Csm4